MAMMPVCLDVQADYLYIVAALTKPVQATQGYHLVTPSRC
jgi:hypothetical protein